MNMNMWHTKFLAPAANNFLDGTAADPLMPFGQEQRWVLVLCAAGLDVFAKGLQSRWADHEMSTLASFADNLTRAEVLGSSIGRLALPGNDAVLVQLAKLGETEAGVNEQQDDSFVPDVRDAIDQRCQRIVIHRPGSLVVYLWPLHPLDWIGNVAVRVVAKEFIEG